MKKWPFPYFFAPIAAGLSAVMAASAYYHEFWLVLLTSLLLTGAGALAGRQYDISRRHEMESEKAAARMEALVSALNDGILALDEKRDVILVNEEFCQMFCPDAECTQLRGMKGHDLFELVRSSVCEPDLFLNEIRRLYAANKPSLHHELLLLDGRIYEYDYLPIYAGGSDSGHLWHYRNVTQQREHERILMEINTSLHHLSELDGLTGIPNRRTFDAELAAAADKANMDGTGLSLLMIDIDLFKLYNDTCGHQEGDTCLQLVARTIQDSCTDGELAARYGGEEFAVVIPNGGPDTAAETARIILSAVTALRIPHPASSVSEWITVSIGACSMAGIIQPAELISKADQALYEAKRSGRNRMMTVQEVVKPHPV